MPIITHAPPQLLTRAQKKFLFFILKCIVMLAVISIFLFFLGFAAAVLLHFIFTSKSSSSAGAGAGESETSPESKTLIPEVLYSVKDYETTSDCAICLEGFEDGDKCRELEVCKHLFHCKCVDRWVRKKPSCPVCRRRVDLDLSGLVGMSGCGDGEEWKRLWSVNFDHEGGTSY